MIENGSGFVEVETATLTPIVRTLLGAPAAVVTEGWRAQPLAGGASEGPGLYRVSGTAQAEGVLHPWELICKICAATDGIDPGAWNFPPRESHAYDSGLFAELPTGISAPRCLAVEPCQDGTSRLWLESILDAREGPWNGDQCASAANCLGRFNGAYLAGKPLPDYPWLSRTWLRDFIAPSGAAIVELDGLAGPDGVALVRRLYPPFVVAEIKRLWEERERFLNALDELPQTFCHHDAFRRNLLHPINSQGTDHVAIDWAYAGQGAVGEDLGQLVVASLYFFEVGGIEPRDLADVCFASYLEGLREAGWTGNQRLAQLGFSIDASLRTTVGLLPVILSLINDPGRQSIIEDRFGRALEETVEAWAELWPLLFDLAHEARALLTTAGPEDW